MASKYQKVDSKRWPGVYYYEGKTRFQGKPDVCYFINYKVDGKLKWEKVGWKSERYTPQIAAEIRADRVKKARHGEEVKTAKEIRAETAKANKTVEEVGRIYFDDRGKGLKGYYADINRFELHLVPLLGDTPVGKLSELDIAKVKKALSDRSPATVWNVLELLRRIVNYGVKHRLTPKLDFTISMPRKDNEVIEFLTPDEMDRLQAVLDSWPTAEAPRMLKLAMFTGMRRGEVFSLKDEDLNFNHSLIRLVKPKGGKSLSVPMNPIAEEILKEQIEWRDKHYPGSPYIFPGRDGGQRVECKAVKRIKSKAGLPEKFRIFHGLRHHFAVTLANSGEFTLDMIGELLTHKSHAMTQRYASFLPDTMKKASSRAAELLTKTNTNSQNQENAENG